MSTEVLTEDDDIEIIEVDEIPEQKAAEEPGKEEPESHEADDEDDDEDERLADKYDEDGDDDEDPASANRKKRAKRRQLQKAARERAERELQFLRSKVAELEQSVKQTNTGLLTQTERDLEARLEGAKAKVRNAEAIMAKAYEAGNGEDAVLALRMRDEALREEIALADAKKQIELAKKTPAPANETVKRYASDWMAQNPWYKPNGLDEASAYTDAVDKRLTAEGYDPASENYWLELTRRVSAQFNQKEPSKREEPAPKKKAPPLGATREHAPASTKKEVYVTPERKQAMIDAGYWDDPKLRSQMLKEYQAYDRQSAR